MKRITVRAICLICTALLAFSALGGCTGGEVAYIESDDLFSLAQTVYINGEVTERTSLEREHLFFSGTGETVVEAYFPEGSPEQLNEILLTVDGNTSELKITVQAVDADSDVNEFETIYEQVGFTGTRACCFSTVNAKALRIIASSKTNEAYNITSAQAYYVKGGESSLNFKVFAQLDAAAALTPAALDVNWFASVTDVIISNAVTCNAKGELTFVPVPGAAEGTADDALFTSAVVAIRSAAAQLNKNIKIHCCVEPVFSATADGTSEQISQAVSDTTASSTAQTDASIPEFSGANATEPEVSQSEQATDEALSASINSFVTAYSLDGVIFDLSDSASKDEAEAVNSSAKSLKEQLGDKALGAYLDTESPSLSGAAKSSMDYFFVAPSQKAEASKRYSFEYTVDCINAFLSDGHDANKLITVIPFYGAPEDGGSFTYDYAVEARSLGMYSNIATGTAPSAGDNCLTRYYNSAQLVIDKTCISVDSGLGGICAAYINCDAPASENNSLINAVASAVTSRPLPSVEPQSEA